MFKYKFPRLFVLLLFIFSTSPAIADSEKKAKQVEEIVATYSGMTEYVLKISTQSKDIPPKTKKNLDEEFSKVLIERFSEEELDQISAVVKKLGSKDLVRMTQIVMQAFTDTFKQGDKLQDVDIKIAPSYEAYLDKVFTEKQFDEKFKTIYFSSQAKDQAKRKKNSADKDESLTEKANQFVARAKKHVKKVISASFTEEQYRTYFEFEATPLGKRFNDSFQQSAVKAVRRSSS